MMTTIFTLPVELAQHILSFCHPWDVASFSATCYSAFSLVYRSPDQYLWRHLFVKLFDPPVRAIHATDIFSRTKLDWKIEVTSRMKVELALLRGPISATKRLQALKILLAIIEDSSCAVSNTGSSLNVRWLNRILQLSLLLHNLYSIPESEDDQLHAQLRAYLCLTIDHRQDKKTLSKLIDRRDISRAYVYNLLNYKAENNWGPFLQNGNVNWIHIEHLMNVVSLNLRELPGNWALTRPPSVLDLDRPSPFLPSQTVVYDWAGVEGTWRRCVCFMDYRDLFAFNFTDLADGPRHPNFFKDPRFREATRLIEVKMHLVSIHELRFHKISDNLINDSVMHPPLSFTGSSKGVNGNEAAVEGSVMMGRDGVVRWQLISIYDDHPQWSSNGIQIGSAGSVLGVVGVWTTTNHDQDDPAGPFWLWKVDHDSPPHLMEFP